MNYRFVFAYKQHLLPTLAVTQLEGFGAKPETARGQSGFERQSPPPAGYIILCLLIKTIEFLVHYLTQILVLMSLVGQTLGIKTTDEHKLFSHPSLWYSKKLQSRKKLYILQLWWHNSYLLLPKQQTLNCYCYWQENI